MDDWSCLYLAWFLSFELIVMVFILTWQRIRHLNDRYDRLYSKFDRLEEENRSLQRKVSNLEHGNKFECRFKP